MDEGTDVRVGSAAREEEDDALFTLLLLFGGFGVDETCCSSWAETGREMLARLFIPEVRL